MTSSRQSDGIMEIRRRLAGAHRIAIIGIGDELSPVDRLGMLAAREIEALNLPGVKVFLAGTVPESMTGPVKTYRPDRILLLDAAEMGRSPGTVTVLDPGIISAGLFSTHALPLPVVMDYLANETGAPVTLLGIQPDMAQTLNKNPKEEKSKGEKTDGERGLPGLTDLAHILRDVRTGSTT